MTINTVNHVDRGTVIDDGEPASILLRDSVEDYCCCDEQKTDENQQCRFNWHCHLLVPVGFTLTGTFTHLLPGSIDPLMGESMQGVPQLLILMHDRRDRAENHRHGQIINVTEKLDRPREQVSLLETCLLVHSVDPIVSCWGEFRRNYVTLLSFWHGDVSTSSLTFVNGQFSSALKISNSGEPLCMRVRRGLLLVVVDGSTKLHYFAIPNFSLTPKLAARYYAGKTTRFTQGIQDRELKHLSRKIGYVVERAVLCGFVCRLSVVVMSAMIRNRNYAGIGGIPEANGLFASGNSN